MFRTRMSSVVVAAMAAWTVSASSVYAQAPARDGFFIGFGFGWGSLGIEGAGERQSAVAGYFKIGGALSDKVLLAGETNSWTKTENDATLTAGHLSAVAYVYPTETGFYLRGGLGVARIDLDVGVLGGGDSGLGLTGGVGYDIGFGGRFGLTPFANWLYGDYDGGSTSMLQVGLGFNWY